MLTRGLPEVLQGVPHFCGPAAQLRLRHIITGAQVRERRLQLANAQRCRVSGGARLLLPLAHGRLCSVCSSLRRHRPYISNTLGTQCTQLVWSCERRYLLVFHILPMSSHNPKQTT